MEREVYPESPGFVPADLAAPSAQYKRRIVAAVLAVAAFFTIYFGITAWLALTTWRAVAAFQSHTWRTFVVGIPAGFLFLVMIKGLFVRRKMSRDALLEVTAEDEPRLLAFIHKIADETGAPRPSKVFLSADVNAAVFLDVGLINLLIPSRKNLIVGLGLVNGLTLDEFKAVVAHEFGHFAQRSMGIGQWVSIAQTWVGDLVMRRDMLDRFIHGLSYTDIRIAWIGWFMRVLVWALRAIIDQLLRFVIMISRALSRQMEFQADLVSVRVAGSDSLVHALHRLGAADRAWGEAANFVLNENDRGRRCVDMFSVQSRFLERYREVHALADHGVTPARPARADGSHRVFDHAIGDAPRMWSTHPSNQSREENCKAHYVPSTLDERPAWAVFADEHAARRRVTAHFIELATRPREGAPPPPAPMVPVEEVTIEESLDRVDGIFSRPSLDRRYQGLYTTMPMTRALGRQAGGGFGALTVEPDGDANASQLAARFGELFVEDLSEEVEEFFRLGEELASLEGLKKGYLKAPGGVIMHRGEHLRRKELASVVDGVRGELETHRKALAGRFQSARGIAKRIARGLDAARGEKETSLEAHHDGLVRLLEYAEHTAAILVDVVTYFEHVIAIVLADGHVSNSEMRRLEADGARVAFTLRRIYDERTRVVLCDPVRFRITDKGVTWPELLGPELHLHPPMAADFGQDWIGIAASWWSSYISALSGLSSQTMDAIIEFEEQLLAAASSDDVPAAAAELADAPTPAQVPTEFPRLYFGEELERQERLGWWDRFQTAEGFGGAFMRFVVAAAVFTPALMLGSVTTESVLFVYNAFEIPVDVQIDDQHFRMNFQSVNRVDLVDGDTHQVRVTTFDGQEIESFELEDIEGMDEPVYNIANAGAFVKYWVTYGNMEPRDPVFRVGQLFEGDASVMFGEAPEQVSTSSRSSGAYRSVVDALRDPQQVVTHAGELNAAAVARTQLDWNPIDSTNTSGWLNLLPEEERVQRVESLALANPGAAEVLWIRSRTLSGAQMDEFCARPSLPQFDASYCAKDGTLLERPELRLSIAGRLLGMSEAFRLRRYPLALELARSVRGAGGSDGASAWVSEARAVRILQPGPAWTQLASDEMRVQWLAAVETGAPDVGPFGEAVQRRIAGDFSPSALTAVQELDAADQLAFGAASRNAPPSWLDALRRSNLPFESAEGALVAWALAHRVGDALLKQRAAAAYLDHRGSLTLAQFDPPAGDAPPVGWLAEGLEFSTYFHRIMVGAVLYAEFPQTWKDELSDALFAIERPRF